MKINKLILSAAVIAFGLASCNQNDDPKVKTDGSSDLFLQISQAQTTDNTRAISESVAAGEVTEFSEGGLFFTDNAGNILNYTRITSDGSTGTFTITQLQKGVIIENVSTSATKLQIVGGYDFGSNDYATMAQVAAIVTDLEEQADRSNYGIGNATLFGSGDLKDFTGQLPAYIAYVAAGGTETADKEVAVELKALMARFEITQLRSDNSDPAVTHNVDEFTLAGIYIDNIYYQLGITGELNSASTLYYFGQNQDPDNFDNKSTGGEYFDYNGVNPYDKTDDTTWNWEHLLFNNQNMGSSTPSANGDTFAPDDVSGVAQVWSYNFFPVANTTSPHIVFHLTGVKVEDKTSIGTITYFNGTGEAYLVATKFRNKVGNGLVNFEGGWIYRLEDVVFNYNDLGEEPGPDPDDEFSVWVEVSIMPWKDKSIVIEW